MSSVFYSLSLSMFAVAQAFTSLLNDRIEISWSILVVWLECRFLDTEVDGSNPGNSVLCP